MSGFKINFHKRELLLFGDTVNKREQYKMIFTCPNGSLPMKYLGIPVNKIRIRNKDWNGIETKIAKKCAGWQGRLLNIAGRTTLVQTCLTNMPLYMMSFYRIPVGVRKRIDYHRARLV